MATVTSILELRDHPVAEGPHVAGGISSMKLERRGSDFDERPRRFFSKIPVGNNGLFAIVDAEDEERLLRYRWSPRRGSASSRYYAGHYLGRASNPRYLLMHRLLMGAMPGEMVDHIDRNGLNNSKSNLRICTAAQNSVNRSNKNTFRGLHKWRKNSWHVQIAADGSSHYIGSFKDINTAAHEFNLAALLLRDHDFVQLNTIPMTTEQLAQVFVALGYSVPTSADAFRAAGVVVPQ